MEKIRCENAVSLVALFLLSAALSVDSGQQSLQTAAEEPQGLTDDWRIMFRDMDSEDDLAKEFKAFLAEEKAFKNEREDFERDLAEHLVNKSRHEANMVAFEEEKVKLEKKLEDYKVASKEDDDMYLKKSTELDAEVKDLAEQQQEVEKDEVKIEKSKKEMEKLREEMKDRTGKLNKDERDLNEQIDDLGNQRKNLAKEVEKEEKQLQAKYNKCVDVPTGFVKFVDNYEEGNTKLCYNLFKATDLES